MSVGVFRRGCVSFAAACAFAAFPLPVHAQTPLKVALDGRIEAPSTPLFVALERGYFKAQGLDVTIEPSAGSAEAFTRVASGAFDIGVGDINALIRYRDQNPSAPLKAVFVINNWPSYAIVGRKSRGVMAPADLEGKRLGAPAAEPATAAWPAFAKLNGIDPSKVRVLNVGTPVREPMLAAGEVDAITGTSYGSPITLREKGVPAEDITTLLMAEHGLDMYGSAIFVNAKLAAEKPEAVKGFLRALVLGLKETIRDPVAALPTVLKRINGGNRDLELERLIIVVRDSMLTPEVKANGLGGIDPVRLERALEQIGVGYNFNSAPKPGEAFDPSFLPPEAERRLE